QPCQPEHRDQPLRRPKPLARGLSAAVRPPRGADALGCLLGLGLVEEVELDVAIALGHRRFQPKLRPLYPVNPPRMAAGARQRALDVGRFTLRPRGLSGPPAKPSKDCRTSPSPRFRASSSSAGTDLSARSEPVGPDPSGSPATSRTVSTLRSRSSPAKGRQGHAPS